MQLQGKNKSFQEFNFESTSIGKISWFSSTLPYFPHCSLTDLFLYIVVFYYWDKFLIISGLWESFYIKKKILLTIRHLTELNG